MKTTSLLRRVRLVLSSWRRSEQCTYQRAFKFFQVDSQRPFSVTKLAERTSSTMSPLGDHRHTSMDPNRHFTIPELHRALLLRPAWRAIYCRSVKRQFSARRTQNVRSGNFSSIYGREDFIEDGLAVGTPRARTETSRPLTIPDLHLLLPRRTRLALWRRSGRRTGHPAIRL